jgi:hypothetical protein
MRRWVCAWCKKWMVDDGESYGGYGAPYNDDRPWGTYPFCSFFCLDTWKRKRS